MAIRSGLAAQVGAADETTYGTAATVTDFYEFRSESLIQETVRLESSALRSGTRVIRSDHWSPAGKSVSGDLAMELGTVGMGRWFKHALGSLSTTQPDATAAPTVYRHTFTPGDLPVGQTIQVGKPSMSGTVQPFTFKGCKTSSWALNCVVEEHATLTSSLIGQDTATDVPLEVAAYPAGLVPLTFVNGSVTLAGSPQDVRSVSLEGTNGLAQRRFLGSQVTKEPVEVGTEGSQARTYLATLETEFEDLTNFQRFVDGAEATMVLLFQGPVIEATFPYEVQITANVRFDSNTPQVAGPEIVMQSMPVKVVDNGTLSIKVEYQTTDATV